MTQANETTLPPFFKDASGFCYVATTHLAAKPGMTPWDGEVDRNGFAVDAPAPAPAAPKRSRSQSKRVAEQQQDPLDAALGELRDAE